MEGQINVWIIFASSMVFIGLVTVLALYLYFHKKREGISYPVAIRKIKSFITQRYGALDGNQERFCEEFGISEKESLLEVLRNDQDTVLFPKVIEEALNKIGMPVVFINRAYYAHKRYA